MRFSDYVIDTDSLTPGERGELCSAVLTALEGVVVRFETDIPWSQADRWPADVHAAAGVLSAVPGATGDRAYARTGVVTRSDDEVWRAFTRFGGYSYDASAWPDQPRTMVSLTDEGKSVTLRIDDDELATVRAAIPRIPVLTRRDAKDRWRRIKPGE